MAKRIHVMTKEMIPTATCLKCKGKISFVEGCSLRQSQRMLQTRELIFDYLIKPCFHHKFVIGRMETLSSIASYYSTRPLILRIFEATMPKSLLVPHLCSITCPFVTQDLKA